MSMNSIGDTLTECLKEHKRKPATLFLDGDNPTFVSSGISHYEQRVIYTETVINKRRAEQGLPPFDVIDEKIKLWSNCAVDLIIVDGFVDIRPETDRMDLALKADQVLQQEFKGRLPKQLIRFRHANLEPIKESLRTAGEYWRISPFPRMEHEVQAEINSSRIALNGDPIYYYSSTTGIRYLTCAEFEKLSQKDDESLRRHLIEIRDFSQKPNRHGYREVAFFEADSNFSSKNFKDIDFENASPSELRNTYCKLLADFKAAVPRQFHNDDVDDTNWRNHMVAALVDSKNEAITGDLVKSLPPVFFRMVRWLPGGRFKGRELIFDAIFNQNSDKKSANELDNLIDERVKGFIGNYICEFGAIEYINVGRIMPSIRREGRRHNGHRVYLAEIKLHGKDEPVLRILRVLQWGIRERLDEGKELLTAITESMEYVDFTTQRRLACGELGMPLPGRIDLRHITEKYDGKQAKYHKTPIWTFYFERDFIKGLPTDMIPDDKLQDPEFCRRLAKLLGQAAAPNMAVGRIDKDKDKVLFDEGDEMLLFNSGDYPNRLVVADHAGTFYDYTSDLITFAKAYAKPVISRLGKVANKAEFKQVYLHSLKKRLLDLQQECKAQEDVFRVRFELIKDEEGTFADRWNKALTRLQETDIDILIETISMEIEKQT